MSSTGGSVRGARYVSHRASRLAPWGKPVRVPELEDLLNADIAFVSDDDCVVYITRGTHTSMATRGR